MARFDLERLQGLGADPAAYGRALSESLFADPALRAAFVEAGKALRDWGRWALFAMREEFVARLDPYLHPVPTRLGTRYRLELLGAEAARLAVGAEDGVIYSWDWRARDVRQSRGHWGRIESVAYQPSGEYMATTGHDGTVHLWPANPEVVISLACTRVSRDLGPEEWAQYAGDVQYQPICPEAAQPLWVNSCQMPPPGDPIAAPRAQEPPGPHVILYFEAVPGTNASPAIQSCCAGILLARLAPTFIQARQTPKDRVWWLLVRLRSRPIRRQSTA